MGAASLGGMTGGVLKHRRLAIGINYQFNSLTTAYQGTQRIADPLQRTASVSYFALQIEYGIVPGISLYAALPFADKNREITVRSAVTGLSETASFGSSGIADATVLAKYQLIKPTITSPWEVAVGGGVSLPTGSFTNEQNNAQLSIDLQPGSGALAVLAWAFTAFSFPEAGTRIIGSAAYRYAGTNFDGYRIGDEVVTDLGSEFSFDEHFVLSLLVRSRFAWQDFASRRILSATGGTYHDVLPSLSYDDGPSHVRAFAQVPLYRNVRGIQLTVSAMLGVEYSYSFDWGTNADVGAE